MEIDDETLTQEERLAFSDLSDVTSRFSQFKEDHEKYPGAYSSEKELKEKIIETKKKLEDK